MASVPGPDAQSEPRTLSDELDALHDLDERDAQLVVLRTAGDADEWRPAHKGYNSVRFRELLDAIIAWRRERGPGSIGVVPWSLGLTALDVDEGDPAELVARRQPLAVLRTRRGWHLLYRDDEPRGNGRFTALGVKGDVRSGIRGAGPQRTNGGYIRFHPGGAEGLSDALRDPPPEVEGGPPVDLFEHAGVPAPPEDPDVEQVDRTDWRSGDWRNEGGLLVRRWNRNVPEGERNDTLLRALYGSLLSPTNWRSTEAEVIATAERLNSTLLKPMPVEEVRKTARSAYRMAASRSEAERTEWLKERMSERGKLVAAKRRMTPLLDGYRFASNISAREAGRHGGEKGGKLGSGSPGGIRSGEVRREQNAERDAAILQAREAGESQRAIARRFGISQGAVIQVLKTGGGEAQQERQA